MPLQRPLRPLQSTPQLNSPHSIWPGKSITRAPPRAGVEQYLSEMSRKLKPSDVLDHAVSSGWLKISDDGLPVHPGEVYPSLEGSAMRYVPGT